MNQSRMNPFFHFRVQNSFASRRASNSQLLSSRPKMNEFNKIKVFSVSFHGTKTTRQRKRKKFFAFVCPLRWNNSYSARPGRLTPWHQQEKDEIFHFFALSVIVMKDFFDSPKRELELFLIKVSSLPFFLMLALFSPIFGSGCQFSGVFCLIFFNF